MKLLQAISVAAIVIICAQLSKAQWTNTGTLDGSNVNDLIFKDSSIYAATSFGHVFISTDMGKQWIDYSYGLTNYRGITALTARGEYLFAATSEIGMFRLRNNDLPWMEANKGLSNIHVSSLASDDSIIIAGTYGGGIFLAKDFGSWSPSNNGLTDSTVYSLLLKGSRVFAGTSNGLFISYDKGESWKEAGGDLKGKAVSAITVCPNGAGGENILICTANNGIFISANDGNSWSSVNHGLINNSVFDIVSYGTKLFAATSYGIFYSSNYGAEWKNISDGIPSGGIESIFYSLEVIDNHLFAGNVLSVWKRPLSEVTGIDETDGKILPGKFVLYQNYPNPFNPVTKIGYEIPRRSNVKIEVFDVLGRKVETLLNKEHEAGRYSINFNADKLGSGIYFYTIAANNFNQTKKMLLLK